MHVAATRARPMCAGADVTRSNAHRVSHSPWRVMQCWPGIVVKTTGMGIKMAMQAWGWGDLHTIFGSCELYGREKHESFDPDFVSLGHELMRVPACMMVLQGWWGGGCECDTLQLLAPTAAMLSQPGCNFCVARPHANQL